VAVTPDGAHVFVANLLDNTVSVIATATNIVTAVPVGSFPTGVTVTPDGAHVYVTNQVGNTVSVIGTATNTVTATVPVGSSPVGVAVTPDGTSIYVSNSADNTVSVIAAATNTVTAIVPVGLNPDAFGQFISSSPTVSAVPFASLTARVEIERSHRLTKQAGDSFELRGHGVLGHASHGLAPHAEDVTLGLGSLSLTVPAGSFVKKPDTDEDRGQTDRDRNNAERHRDRLDHDDRDADGHGDRHDRDDRITTYSFKGVIAGVSLSAEIEVGPKRSFSFRFEGRNANLSLVVNPVTVALAIGEDVGHVVVKADIDR
jgi:YVTN family beta-propeller protein